MVLFDRYIKKRRLNFYLLSEVFAIPCLTNKSKAHVGRERLHFTLVRLFESCEVSESKK